MTTWNTYFTKYKLNIMKTEVMIINRTPSQVRITLLLLSHSLPPLSRGVDVYCETPPFSPVLPILPGQLSLRQVVPDGIHPPPL